MPGFVKVRHISLAAAAITATAAASPLTGPTTLRHDEPDDALANVPEAEMEFPGPANLPGREPGPRTRPSVVPLPPTPVEPPQPPPREWFGGMSWWEWQRATGDWGTLRTSLEDVGLTFAGSYTLDWMSVWSGGVNNRASTRSLLDLNLTLDTLKAFGLPGGSFYVDFQSSDMRGGPQDTGSFMAPTNIETGDNIDQLSEVWYQQIFADGLVRVRAGKIDAGLEFGYSTAAENFLHQSNVFLFTNSLLPTYPNPACGAEIFLYPTDNLYVGAGFFDGSLSKGVRTGRRGPDSMFDGDEYIWLAEAGITWGGAGDAQFGSLGPGRVVVGGWGHTGEFETPGGQIDDGTGAAYVLFQQRLIAREDMNEPSDKAGLIAFCSAGFADADVSDAKTQVTLGLTLNGTFAGRDDDAAGFLVTWLDLSNSRGFEQNETAFELMYRFRVTPFSHVTPALQYIANPSGDPTIDDALVGVVRFEIDF